MQISLDVDSSTDEGDREFTIKATSGSRATEQKAIIALEGRLGASAIINHLKSNWIIYTVVIVDLILILIIIFAVRRMVGKRQ